MASRKLVFDPQSQTIYTENENGERVLLADQDGFEYVEKRAKELKEMLMAKWKTVTDNGFIYAEHESGARVPLTAQFGAEIYGPDYIGQLQSEVETEPEVLTWGRFKKLIENQGVKDDHVISWIDIDRHYHPVAEFAYGVITIADGDEVL